MMPVVYLAGPFRGRNHYAIHRNICRAEDLALQVWQLGAACLCPHLNTAHFQGAAPDDVWLEGDLAMLAKCDAILMTPDWTSSSGARAERDFAADRSIPIFDTVNALAEWLARPKELAP